MSAVDELLVRVEAATGPEEELAVDIFEALEIASYIPDDMGDPTSSIDAAVALVEKILPGCRWVIASADPVWDEPIGCTLKPADFSDESIDGEGETPPLAILAALLRALSSPVHPQGS